MIAAPSLIWSLPFVALLLSIALFPLFAPKWWSRNYPWIALPLGLLVALYYSSILGAGERMLHSGEEYFSFIALVGSLFVVSGGIHVHLVGRLTPMQNTLLLAVGAVFANVAGTTGAAMILIRPFLRGNSWRFAPYQIAFFIFIVANCGGALTPIGDPPLFLGYLKGVPFFWPLSALWYKWFLGVGTLLLIYYVLDRRDYRQQSQMSQVVAEREDRYNFSGMYNLAFIAIIVGAAFVQKPHFLREGIMIAAAIGSYYLTPRLIHRQNGFDFHPVKEVAILFAGIFATMVPALDWLSAHAGELGLTSTTHYYWMTGTLSAVLDNAPTYLNSLTAAMGIHGLSTDSQADILTFVSSHGDLLRSISISSVFFGAATYIGNGPNFMCKSIADQMQLPSPSFVDYIYRFTLPYLLPVLVLTYFWVM